MTCLWPSFFVARSLARRFLRTYFILRSTSRYLPSLLSTVSTKVVNNREYYVCMDHAMMNEMVVRWFSLYLCAAVEGWRSETSLVSCRMRPSWLEMTTQAVSMNQTFPSSSGSGISGLGIETAETRVNTIIACPFVYGSCATVLPKKSQDIGTHKWTLFLRGPNGEDLSGITCTLHSPFFLFTLVDLNMW